MRLKRLVYMTIGCIGMGAGVIGTVLPVLPTVPFLLLAAYCFGRSSKRLNDWFVNTKLYKNNLAGYMNGKGMTKRVKIRIMVIVTMLMSIGFIAMHSVPVGRMILVGVWVFHVVYFLLGIKTLKEAEVEKEDTER